MRELKFRAWDKKRKELVYFDLSLCNSESRIWFNEQIVDNNVMQYVGLKDKNGKEVYEGDIIKHIVTIERNIFEVIYENGRFIARSPYIKHDLYFLTKNKDSEVIGNIFENPEILERNK